jgi:hypothetical protein
MPYRLLGKFFFLFYICPRIVREFRLVRKYLNPIINEAIRSAAEKAKKDVIDIVKEDPASRSTV